MLLWATHWEGHSIRAVMDSRGGWPGLGLLGGSNYYILYVDQLCAAKLKVSQAGDLLGSLTGKKLILKGKFKTKKGAVVPLSVGIPLAVSFCQFESGGGAARNVAAENTMDRLDVEAFEKLKVADPTADK